MEFAVSRLSEKGQIVIPRDIRNAMDIRVGTKFVIIADKETIVLQRVEVAGERWRLREVMAKTKDFITRLGLRKLQV